MTPAVVPHEKCWAKTSEGGAPGVTPLAHNLYVALVFAELLRETGMSNRYPDTASWILLVAWHDIGKVAPGFLAKCPAWLVRENIINPTAWSLSEPDHAKIGQFTIIGLLTEAGLDEDSARLWACVVGAHHGRHHGLRFHTRVGMSDDAWDDERRRLATDLKRILKDFLPTDGVVRLPAQSRGDCDLAWRFAGLLSVSDWIGSDEFHFPADRDLSFEEAKERARRAVAGMDWRHPETRTGADFRSLFGFEPNALQTATMATIGEPGINAPDTTNSHTLRLHPCSAKTGASGCAYIIGSRAGC